MNDEAEFFFNSGNYLESLVKCRVMLDDIVVNDLLMGGVAKLERVIDLELELALRGAEKAIAECNKTDNKSNIRPIK